MTKLVVIALVLIAANAAQAQQARVPCSMVTPGLQYECALPDGKTRPAGPAAARQEKHFDACMAKGGRAAKCLDEAVKVK